MSRLRKLLWVLWWTATTPAFAQVYIRDGARQVAPGAIVETNLDAAIRAKLNAGGAGSVTSVNVATAIAGLAFTGGPITGSGTITFGITDVAALRGALGLGDAATRNVGTTAGTVAAGDHAHAGVYQPVGDYLTSASSLDATKLTGTLNDLRLSSNVPLLNAANVFSAAQTIGSSAADPTYSAELVSNGDFAGGDAGWTVGAGWSTAGGVATHAPGSAAALSQAITVSAGTYQVTATVTRTAGSFTLAVGGVSSPVFTSNVTTAIVATGAAGLVVTPSSDFEGTVGNISVRRVTAFASPVLSLRDSSGAVRMEFRAMGSSNTASGVSALYSNTTGYSNTASGVSALTSNTTGYSNTASGYQAGRANTTGNRLTFVGYNAGNASSDGLTNATALGNEAQVTASNSLVLGGTGAYGVNVGIGSTAPTYSLHIAPTTTAANGNLFVLDPSNTRTVVKAGSSQSSALTTWQSNAGAAVASVGPTGAATFSGLTVTGLPVYADNAAALAGGLTAGQAYRTSTGVLMVTY